MAEPEDNPGPGAGRVILYLGLGVLTLSGLALAAWFLIVRKAISEFGDMKIEVPEGEEPEEGAAEPVTGVLRVLPTQTIPAEEIPPQTIKVETL